MIRENLERLKTEISEIAVQSGRDPQEIQLIAVSKTISVENIVQAYENRQRDFGENRVQEFLDKEPHLPSDIRWHFIGHLQTNKVKQLVGKVDFIHSVDSLRLACEINERFASGDKKVQILVQVKTTDEKTKFGLDETELPEFFEKCSGFSHAHIAGLMTIGPFTEAEDRIRESFRRLSRIRDSWHIKGSWELRYLSMGMTNDYKIAIEEGANFLRIGTEIFGERQSVA